MSRGEWTESGFGYELLNSSNLPNVREFIAKNGGRIGLGAEILEAAAESEDEEELNGCLKDSIPLTVALIINDMEGFNLFSGFDGNKETGATPHIGVSPALPWQFSVRENVITEARAVQILQKYAKVLGVKEEPDDFVLHYFG